MTLENPNQIERTTESPAAQKTFEQARRDEAAMLKSSELLFGTFVDHADAQDEYVPYSLSDATGAMKGRIREGFRNSEGFRYTLSHALRNITVLEDAFVKKNKVETLYEENRNAVIHLVAGAYGANPVAIEEALMSEPKFYREDKNAPQQIALPPEVLEVLPVEFSDNPTQYIEQLPLVDRDYSELRRDRTMNNLTVVPYDWTKVHQIGDLVFKRVDFGSVHSPLEEIDRARAIGEQIKKISHTPPIDVVKFLGYVVDQGNVYLVSERVPNSTQLYSLESHTKIMTDIKKAVGDSTPLRATNVLVEFERGRPKKGEHIRYVLCDFESVSPVEAADKCVRQYRFRKKVKADATQSSVPTEERRSLTRVARGIDPKSEEAALARQKEKDRQEQQHLLRLQKLEAKAKAHAMLQNLKDAERNRIRWAKADERKARVLRDKLAVSDPQVPSSVVPPAPEVAQSDLSTTPQTSESKPTVAPSVVDTQITLEKPEPGRVGRLNIFQRGIRVARKLLQNKKE